LTPAPEKDVKVIEAIDDIENMTIKLATPGDYNGHRYQ
jgi:hypothetical protein